jgi:hypothetical protein
MQEWRRRKLYNRMFVIKREEERKARENWLTTKLIILQTIDKYFRLIKSGKLGWADSATCFEMMRYEYRDLVWNLRGKLQLWSYICRGEMNIKSCWRIGFIRHSAETGVRLLWIGNDSPSSLKARNYSILLLPPSWVQSFSSALWFQTLSTYVLLFEWTSIF